MDWIGLHWVSKNVPKSNFVLTSAPFLEGVGQLTRPSEPLIYDAHQNGGSMVAMGKMRTADLRIVLLVKCRC